MLKLLTRPLIFLGAIVFIGLSCKHEQGLYPDFPRVWTSYGSPVKTLEEDLQDMVQHGVQCVSVGASNVADARKKLELARELGLKYDIRIGSHLTVNVHDIETAGLDAESAVMIGGVYRGKAIDRHVFSFDAAAQTIIIEPPVYNQYFAYTGRKSNQPVGHYYAEIGDPLRAEIIVPLKAYDGQQHLRIIPAKVRGISGKVKLEDDSVVEDMPPSYETSDRNLYELTFDLSGLDEAMLDMVGIAVYWVYGGSEEWYMLSAPPATQCHPYSHEVARQIVREKLSLWTEANGGTFPEDVIVAGRYGDECFYITGHLRNFTPAVNYPIWDFSETALKDFLSAAGKIEPPRTWGFPEIYGEDAYAWFLYQLHKSCASLVRTVQEEVDKHAPRMMVYRNTARDGVFTKQNDHDGTGPELLTREFDIVHLDPYPVTKNGYLPLIPRDMSYYAGLARRYGKPLLPWMQAHDYVPTGLVHVNADEVRRMMDEQKEQGFDGIKWLGYSSGQTFPSKEPGAWEAAGEIHHELLAGLPAKPVVRLGVVRSYRAWAVSSQMDGQIRNPADWLMQQLLEVWAVKYGNAYDVFEIPPDLSQVDLEDIQSSLKEYPYLISNIPWENAWVIGENTKSMLIPKSEAKSYQLKFEKQLKEKNWLE